MANTADLQVLYRDNPRFKRYVDRNRIQYQKTLEEMLQDALVREYAKECVEEEEIDSEVIKYLEARDFPPQTQGDRIRGMSDEDIAEDRVEIMNRYRSPYKKWVGDFEEVRDTREQAVAAELEWLRSEVVG